MATKKLLFAGDVMLGRWINELLRHRPPEFPWGDTLPLFESADWRACNLECVMSDRGVAWTATPKSFRFRSDAKNIAVLQAAHIDAVSLANNHTLDFENRALEDMLSLLDRARILHAGAGRTPEEAESVATANLGELRIGWLAFTDNQPEWEATSTRSGVCYVPVDLDDPRSARLMERIRQTRSGVDVLIVSAHWGPNWGDHPPWRQIPFAHALVEAGADLVFGHSAHVFRGVELYHGRPILYSAGDLVDDYAVDPDQRNDRSFLFVIEVAEGELLRLKIHPTVIREFQACLAQGPEAEEIAGKMIRLCRDFGTPAEWHEHEHCLEIPVKRTRRREAA